MKKFITGLVTFTGVSVTFLLLMAFSMVLEGVVLYYLWLWFVVPLGAPAIGLLHALGLGMIIHFLTYHFYDFKKNDEAGIWEPLCHLLVRPVFTLGFGWLLHSFM